MLEAAGRKVLLGGNIGAALLPRLGDVAPGDIAVVELSSFQLISMRRSPKIAVVTNVTPNHLDHHKDMQEYIDAKRNILLWQTPPCRAVLGYENDVSRAMAADCKRRAGLVHTACMRPTRALSCGKPTIPFAMPKMARSRRSSRARPSSCAACTMSKNLLAAMAAVWGLVPVEVMARVASTFTGVEHRIEPVRLLDGVQYYNDSIATSPTRTIAGLRSFGQKLVLIAAATTKRSATRRLRRSSSPTSRSWC